MNVWAIADLHLSLARPDARERYASRWRNHVETIASHWRATVAPDDLVLVPGDISMARNHRDLQPDLVWLDRLPGTKVLSPGNHDAWWNGVERIRPVLRRSLLAVEGDALRFGGVIVCGARGAPVLEDEATPPERAEADRQIDTLDRALASAADLRTGGEPLYVLWHYPPFDQHQRAGPCVERFEKSRVTACIYGHIHIQGQWSLATHGEVRGVRYACVAADSIGFRPLSVSRSTN
jgi:predicted phosphohydrolase